MGPSAGLEISFSRSQESAVEFFGFLYVPAPTISLLTLAFCTSSAAWDRPPGLLSSRHSSREAQTARCLHPWTVIPP